MRLFLVCLVHVERVKAAKSHLGDCWSTPCFFSGVVVVELVFLDLILLFR